HGPAPRPPLLLPHPPGPPPPAAPPPTPPTPPPPPPPRPPRRPRAPPPPARPAPPATARAPRARGPGPPPRPATPAPPPRHPPPHVIAQRDSDQHDHADSPSHRLASPPGRRTLSRKAATVAAGRKSTRRRGHDGARAGPHRGQSRACRQRPPTSGRSPGLRRPSVGSKPPHDAHIRAPSKPAPVITFAYNPSPRAASPGIQAVAPSFRRHAAPPHRAGPDEGTPCITARTGCAWPLSMSRWISPALR